MPDVTDVEQQLLLAAAVHGLGRATDLGRVNPRGRAKYNQVTRAKMDRLIREHDLKERSKLAAKLPRDQRCLVNWEPKDPIDGDIAWQSR